MHFRRFFSPKGRCGLVYGKKVCYNAPRVTSEREKVYPRMKKAKQFVPIPPDRDPKFLKVFTRDKRFYKSFFRLLLVISLQQLAALAVNLVDNLMLGSYTELALSGATLVNQIQFTLQQIAAGVGMGIVVLAAQYWGQKRIEPIRKIINVGVKLGLGAGVLFFLASQLFPHGLLAIFTDDEAVIAEGMRYLRVICWTYLIFSVSNSLMYSLQAVETATVGTVMSVSTIFINACLNYCFIYGNFGAPELGVVGAAVATLVSRCVELVIILVYVLRIDRKLQMKLRDLLPFDFTYLRDYVKVAAPVVLSGALWGVAQAAQTAVLGHISAAVIAANAIASVVFQIFAVVGMSCSSVGSVIMGRTVGEGNFQLVRSYSKTMQAIFLILGITAGALLLLCRDLLVSLYAVSEETKELTRGFITVLGITAAGSCYEYPVESGIIGGGGHTKYAAWTDNLFMWLFTIPSAYLSAFVFEFSPLVTFCFLKADQLLKCIPNSITCNRYRWVRVLTRDDASQSAQQA